MCLKCRRRMCLGRTETRGGVAAIRMFTVYQLVLRWQASEHFSVMHVMLFTVS